MAFLCQQAGYADPAATAQQRKAATVAKLLDMSPSAIHIKLVW